MEKRKYFFLFVIEEKWKLNGMEKKFFDVCAVTLNDKVCKPKCTCRLEKFEFCVVQCHVVYDESNGPIYIKTN